MGVIIKKKLLYAKTLDDLIYNIEKLIELDPKEIYDRWLTWVEKAKYLMYLPDINEKNNLFYRFRTDDKKQMLGISLWEKNKKISVEKHVIYVDSFNIDSFDKYTVLLNDKLLECYSNQIT